MTKKNILLFSCFLYSFFYPGGEVFAQWRISELYGKIFSNSFSHPSLKKYGTWPIAPEGVEIIRTGKESSLALVSKDKIKFHLTQNSSVRLENTSLTVLEGSVILENNKEWSFWPIETFIGTLELYKNSKATITIDGSTFSIHIHLHHGLIVLPDKKRLVGNNVYALKQNYDRSLRVVEKSSSSINIQVKQYNNSEGLQLHPRFGIQVSTNSYEYFLYENRPNANTQGLFYNAALETVYKMPFVTSYFHPMSLEWNVAGYVKNQFDQKSPIKKNMAYQSLQGEMIFNKESSLSGYWSRFSFPLSYHMQWRSIDGDPSAVYLSYLKSQPSMAIALNSNHRLLLSFLWQQVSWMHTNSKILGSSFQYSYFWDEEIQYPLKLEVYKKNATIYEFSVGRQTYSYYLGLLFFDYTKSTSGRGIKLCANYYYNESISMNLTYTHQMRDFRDISFSVDYKW